MNAAPFTVSVAFCVTKACIKLSHCPSRATLNPDATQIAI